jgi:hypothetical protein
MIIKNNFSQVLQKLGFQGFGNIFTKKFENVHCELTVDFEKVALRNVVIEHLDFLKK